MDASSGGGRSEPDDTKWHPVAVLNHPTPYLETTPFPHNIFKKHRDDRCAMSTIEVRRAAPEEVEPAAALCAVSFNTFNASVG